MAISIFVPGLNTPNPEKLTEVGLAGLTAKGESGPEAIRVHSGPDERTGMMFLWRQPGVEISHSPSNKRWLPWREDAGSPPSWYLGLEQEFDPGQLARPKQIAGPHVVMGEFLGAAYSWQIPSADQLPMKHRLIAGAWRRVVVGELKEYADACDRMRAVACEACGLLAELDAMDSGAAQHDVQFRFDEADVFVCQALAINYRVTPEIVDMLDLINDETMVRAIFAAIDLPNVVRAVQSGEEQEHMVKVSLS